ncbi:hypothetical protein H4R24_002958 [Coemansia sp. RSA 988]|nr:hypothetical protein H4R24_002958 [Coemansia sp. RSA 988]
MSARTETHAWLVDESLPLEPINEELPSYSPFDLMETLDTFMASTGVNSQITDTPAVTPTGLLVTRKSGLTTATQLLIPKGSLAFVIEDTFDVTVTVRADKSDGIGNGLIYVSAKHQHEQLNNDIQSPVIRAVSRTDEKANCTTLYFGFCSEHVCERRRLECEIILPATSALSELSLRLPSGSQLDISQIMQPMVQSLNVAMIAGTIQLANIGVKKMRVAVADGSIGALNIMATDLIEFIAMGDQMNIKKCTSDGAFRVNLSEGNLSMSQITAGLVSIKGRFVGISMSDVKTRSGYIDTNCGFMGMNRIEAEVLDVRTNTGGVRGCWKISHALTIIARSAIVEGGLELVGDCVHATVKTHDWPVHLAVSENFRGYFDVRTANSVARCGLLNPILYEHHSHWLQGVIGTGASRIVIESANSPVVIFEK